MEITNPDGTVVEARVDGSGTVVLVEPDLPGNDSDEPDDDDDHDAGQSPTTWCRGGLTRAEPETAGVSRSDWMRGSAVAQGGVVPGVAKGPHALQSTQLRWPRGGLELVDLGVEGRPGRAGAPAHPSPGSSVVVETTTGVLVEVDVLTEVDGLVEVVLDVDVLVDGSVLVEVDVPPGGVWQSASTTSN